MTQADAPQVSKLSCANAKQTYSLTMFDLYGVRCFDTYNEVKYKENTLFIDLIKSEYKCPKKAPIESTQIGLLRKIQKDVIIINQTDQWDSINW